MQTEITIPEVGEGVESTQLVKMLVQTGDHVETGQPILELETGKAIVEVPSTHTGKVIQLLVEQGAELNPGQAVLVLETDADASAPPPSPQPEDLEEHTAPARHTVPQEPAAPATAPVVGHVRHVPAAPSVRRLARRLGVEVDNVRPGDGRRRVSKEDVVRHVRGKLARPGTTAGVNLPPLPDFSQWGSVRSETMSAIRRQTAAHLARCWSAIPHVTIHDRADITALEPLRKQYADRARELGGKLTMAVMVTKIAASALKHFPTMNATIDPANSRIIFKGYCHVGIAVATERGLLVPVIRDADTKNMVELAAEITEIAARARTGALALADMQGGTFTVTNLGRIGGQYFTPIINYPEAGILGMGRYFDESDPAGGTPRTFLPLSLSFDHRLVDGADGAAFLKWIIEAIREPFLLALEG